MSFVLPDDIAALARTNPTIHAVAMLGMKYGWSRMETLERMVVELARVDAERVERLVEAARNASVPSFIMTSGGRQP